MAKILVVDDDELSRSLLNLILQKAGFAVQCAADGAEAMQAALSEKPDVIITDAMMPVIDGFELCRQCKRDADLKHVPIIIYSGDYEREEDQEFGLSLGAFRYLLKPSPPAEIVTAVNQALSVSKRSFLTDADLNLAQEMQQLRSYNEILFVKLENKMKQLQQTIDEHTKAEEALKLMQGQIVQQEKMASIGQLAAGVAHEINNPMGFITSNLTSLAKYASRLDEYIAVLQQSLFSCPNHPDTAEIDLLRQKLKVDYVISDMCELINESLDGANRVSRIVQDLKSFSRVDQLESCRTNVNEALGTTINIAWNELKYIATLERDFGQIPDLVCFPQQLNQVFLNLLVNAAQALEKPGTITVRTWGDSDNVFVSVADTGKGMTPEVAQKVFDPFFTTKEAGKGTGLGLSISSDIIRKHGGEIAVESTPGVGTTFTVRLPVDGLLQKV
ncbi:MAG TPA: response regulator [Desulfuromonadales bacterium]|nr:response regulator [Desulfuromonadales bacterium]